MEINQSSRGRNRKGSWLAVLGILALLLSLLFNPGTGHAQAGASGTIVAWGSNSEGQTDIPVGLIDVAAISAGGYHSLALKSDGTVVAWGCGTYDSGQCTVPDGLSGVAAVAAGQWHSLALKSDGTVVAWGHNPEGQTIVPAGLSGVAAIAAGGWHSLALKSDGSVIAWGYNGYGQSDVPAGLSGVTAIAAGTYHSLALKSDGTVVAWGFDDYGQTDVPAGLSGVTAIDGGDRYSLALKSDGTVVAWGRNEHGQANIPAGLSGVIAISAAGWHSLALKSDGTVVGWGWNGMGQTTVPAGLSGVTAISGGDTHSLALVQTVPVGHSPSALDDSYSTNQNTALTVAAPGVLSNDTDEDGDPLSANLVSGPAHGTLTLHLNGSFDYMPATNYAGQDSFTYRATDGDHASDAATVSITVSQTNNAPLAVADSYSVIANTILTVSAPGVLGNDVDADGDRMTATLVSSPSHGALTLNAEGSFAYTPATNYAGSDSFTYKADDGQAGSNIATVSIAIQYSFAGFFDPVKNVPAVNAMKAGAAVPVKFSLAGDQGLDIFAAGFPISQPVSCTVLKPSSGTVRTVTAGSSSLSYDPATGLYTYIWKTDKKWAGKCRVLIIQFDDGTQHLAYFRFK